MRVTRGYAHADRRTLHTMMTMTRGSAEENKQTISKKQFKEKTKDILWTWLNQINI